MTARSDRIEEAANMLIAWWKLGVDYSQGVACIEALRAALAAPREDGHAPLPAAPYPESTHGISKRGMTDEECRELLASTAAAPREDAPVTVVCSACGGAGRVNKGSAPREDEQAPGATGTICVECGKRAMQPAVRVCSGCGAWTFNGNGARVLDEVKREDAEKMGGRCAEPPPPHDGEGK